jgi:hypothetical protein
LDLGQTPNHRKARNLFSNQRIKEVLPEIQFLPVMASCRKKAAPEVERLFV